MKYNCFQVNLEEIRRNLEEIQKKFRRNLEEIQKKFRGNLEEIRTDTEKNQTKFRCMQKNLDIFR